jgi:hypothetical protein
MRFPVLAALLTLAAAAPARAQSGGGVPGGLYPHALALGPEGAGLLGVESDTTDYSDGVSCQKLPTTAGWVSVRGADGSLALLKPLGADLLAGPIRLADGTFSALVSTSTALSGNCAPLRRLERVTLTATGDITARAPLTEGVTINSIQLVAGAVAWLEIGEPSDTYTLRFAADGAAPLTIATGQGVEPQLPAISDAVLLAEPGGGYLLTWAEPKRVRAVSIPATGTPAAPVTVGPSDSVSVLSAGVAATGRAVIAWGTQDGGEEREKPFVARAAIRPRAGAAFARARTLRRGTTIDTPFGGFSLAVASDGRALLAWADVIPGADDDVRYPLYTTVAGPHGGFGRARRDAILGAGLHPGEIEATAFTSRGTALVAYYSHGRSRIARRTPHAKRFAPAKPFNRGGVFDLTPGPDGRLLAIWTTYPHRDEGRVHVAPLRGGA